MPRLFCLGAPHSRILYTHMDSYLRFDMKVMLHEIGYGRFERASSRSPARTEAGTRAARAWLHNV